MVVMFRFGSRGSLMSFPNHSVILGRCWLQLTEQNINKNSDLIHDSVVPKAIFYSLKLFSSLSTTYEIGNLIAFHSWTLMKISKNFFHIKAKLHHEQNLPQDR